MPQPLEGVNPNIWTRGQVCPSGSECIPRFTRVCASGVTVTGTATVRMALRYAASVHARPIARHCPSTEAKWRC
jgi:hypothetical protein